MGLGDEILNTGFAKGAKARGKRMAFGDAKTKRYGVSPWQEIIFKNNPNIAWPRDVNAPDIEWCPYCKGNRGYNRAGPNRRWLWNYKYKVQPGEFFFTSEELTFASGVKKGFVLVEPHVPKHKSCAPNKDWGFDRYQAVADLLLRDGYEVIQFRHHDYPTLARVKLRDTQSIRYSAAAMRRASFIVCPEGGTHHAAAAVGARAVVIIGGFTPASIIGYDFHTNLVGNTIEACGSLERCEHCISAMKSISVEEVYAAALGK
jgi:ADP-heptose:LPS heptosyltransferase